LWEKDFPEAFQNLRVAVDSEDNIIALGCDQYGNASIIKCDNNGNKIWSLHTLPKTYVPHIDESDSETNANPIIDKLLGRPIVGAFMDIAVDSCDNIIITGSTVDSSTYHSSIWIIKLSPADGKILWQTTFSPFPFSFAVALTLDQTDDIYVAGYGATEKPFYSRGLVVKISNPDGKILWRKYRRKPGLGSIYTSIDVNQKNIIFVGGMEIKVVNVFNFLVTKFSSHIGLRIGEHIGDAQAYPLNFIIDQEQNLVAAGRISNGSQYPDTHYLIKFDNGFNTLFRDEGDTEGYLNDVAIMRDNNVVVTGYKAFLGNYYAGLYDGKTGIKLLDMLLDVYGSSWGIAVDNSDDVIIVGGDKSSKIVKLRIKKGVIPPTPEPPKPKPPMPKHRKRSFFRQFLEWLLGHF